MPVSDADFALLAWGKCKRCWGSGYMRFLKQFARPKGAARYDTGKGPKLEEDTKQPLRRQVPRRLNQTNEKSGKPLFVRTAPDPQEWGQEVCACALKRFPRLQETDMDPKTGELFYRPPLVHATEATRKLYAEMVAKVKAPKEADGNAGGTNAP